jgi:hypothetical protein
MQFNRPVPEPQLRQRVGFLMLADWTSSGTLVPELSFALPCPRLFTRFSPPQTYNLQADTSLAHSMRQLRVNAPTVERQAGLQITGTPKVMPGHAWMSTRIAMPLSSFGWNTCLGQKSEVKSLRRNPPFARYLLANLTLYLI